MGKTKKKKKQDPLDSTMSLGDHLEELRSRLIRALVGLGIGAVICLVFFSSIIDFIEGPYNDATAKLLFSVELDLQVDLGKGTISEDLRQAFRDNGVVLFPDVNDVTVKRKGYLFSRRRWLIDNKEDKYCVKVEKSKLNIYKLRPLQTLAPADGIISYIKISLISGLILSSPWVFYQIWMFVAAGLYSNEKRYVHLAAPFSAALFVIGALFFVMVVAPLTLGFLVKFNQRVLGVSSNFTFANYISFVTMLMLVFGISFQTPVAIFFLNKTGLVSVKALRKSRKFVLFGIFIVAAMATPPDVISQITLAVPLYLLFELGILLSWFSERRKKTRDNE
ncbi:MAG: twin-arginine translocase subunit TatC [Planctomycetes bacterium]|nr:twin-arginine translocase subunit TatC [Planctomycetota bacterium]MCH8120979.1 twin-arginine translocase subunit TatC [Planctomycetota bacterium]